MKISWPFLAVASAILVVSVALAFFTPTTDFFRGIIALPGAGALAAALYQLLRDQAAYENKLEIQRRTQIFNLSVTSHMANVAFDKHVEFSEEYLTVINESLRILFQKGPTKDALTLSGNLAAVRMKFPAWVTQDMQLKLISFERALGNIGLHDMRLAHVPMGEERSKVVGEMYNAFAKVTGLQQVTDRGDLEAVAANEIIQYVRGILGVDALAKLRAAVLSQATESLK